MLSNVIKIYDSKKTFLTNVFFLGASVAALIAPSQRNTFAYFALLSGIRTISSSSVQFNTPQIRSRCSRLTLSTNSWYNSLIVFGRIPVIRARSACVIFRSPSLVDNKILIIRHCSFHYKITPIKNLWCFCYFIADYVIFYRNMI